MNVLTAIARYEAACDIANNVARKTGFMGSILKDLSPVEQRFIVKYHDAKCKAFKELSLDFRRDTCTKCDWKGTDEDKALKRIIGSGTSTLICPKCSNEEFYPGRDVGSAKAVGEIELLIEATIKLHRFARDVMPQIGKLVVQDMKGLNEGMIAAERVLKIGGKR